MEGEGKDTNKSGSRNGRKKMGAAAMAALAGGFLLAVLSAIVFAIGSGGEASAILVIYAAIIACALVGIIVVLAQRFREINSGEEDESRQY